MRYWRTNQTPHAPLFKGVPICWAEMDKGSDLLNGPIKTDECFTTQAMYGDDLLHLVLNKLIPCIEDPCAFDSQGGGSGAWRLYPMTEEEVKAARASGEVFQEIGV